MENFEIPERIMVFDSRMKQIVSHYYSRDKKTRTENFKRLFNACASHSMRRELEKYWASMPLRLAKKSVKQDENKETKHDEKREIKQDKKEEIRHGEKEETKHGEKRE